MKTVLVTGASSGFGRRIASFLSLQGYRVYGTSRKINQENLPFEMIELDITKGESIKQAVQQVIALEGKIDVLINNAGIGIAGETEHLSEDQVSQIVNTNFVGVVNLTNTVLSYMRKQQSGLIINISSIGGLIALPYQSMYSATKFAIEGYSESLRYELRNSGINLVLVNPGDFNTEFTQNRILSAGYGTNKEQFDKALSVMINDEKNGSNPDQLSKLVAQIVKTPKPKKRYVVGKFDQKLVCSIKNFIPNKILSNLMRSHYQLD